MPEIDLTKTFSRAALEVARRSIEKGNLPFGCILVDESGHIIQEGENTVVTSRDRIAHCEINLVHQLAGKFEESFLKECTVYASTEPCPMCTAAIFWSGIGTIAFALSKKSFNAIAASLNPSHSFHIPPEELLCHGKPEVKVVGPTIEEEAIALYRKWLVK